MRGRKRESLTIPSADVIKWKRGAHRDRSPWFHVRRARISRGIAAGQRQEDLASQLGCEDSTVWRTCQRYRNLGLGGLLADHEWLEPGGLSVWLIPSAFLDVNYGRAVKEYLTHQVKLLRI